MSGHFDGIAELELPWNEEVVSCGPGAVSVDLLHDHYESQAVVEYRPVTATQGGITVAYCFF